MRTLNKGELLQKLEEEGMLQPLIDKKIIGKKMHDYLKYYREVQFLLLNHTLNDAVMIACAKLEVSERTVWRTLKLLRD
jgi:hypothetical protein